MLTPGAIFASCRALPAPQRVSPAAVRSLRQVVHDIATKEGAAGLFKGALPSILKAAPSAAVTFVAYEFFLHWLTTANPSWVATSAAPAPAAVGSSGSSGGGGAAARRPLH